MIRLALAIVLVLVVAGVAAAAPDKPAEKPAVKPAEANNKHNFTCRTCHSTHFPKGRFLWNSAPDRSTAAGTPLLATESLCYTCHKDKGKGGEFFEPGQSHPINVVPSKNIAVPAELGTVFVKDVGNVITCTSCHDPHGTQRMFLKLPAEDDQLCKACHKFR